jgi:hypothetical protein
MTMFTTAKRISGGLRTLAGMLLLMVVATALVSASPAHAGFGFEGFETAVTAVQGGAPATQAGSHPYAMTVTMAFKHHGEGYEVVPDRDAKNLEVNLPAGLVVNPTAVEARCTEAELEVGRCPNTAAVGVLTPTIEVLGTLLKAPVFAMVTPADVPAELGFNVAGQAVGHIVGRVRTGSDYGVSSEVSDIPQKLGLSRAVLTLWGNPADPSHDARRGECDDSGEEVIEKEEREIQEHVIQRGVCAVHGTGRPLLTMPSACSGPSVATLRAESWQEPGVWTPLLASSPAMPGVEGCGRLDFSPSLAVRPDSTVAGAPSGLSVDLHFPQEESLSGLAEANLKKAVVTLPVGMAVSPSAANGLGACTPEEIGLGSAAPASCPDSAKVGSAEATTPLLEHPLVGSVYVAQQGSNPFGSLLALYLVLEGSGVVIKLPGEVSLDPVSGQVTTTFDDSPQQPVNDVRLHFFGGPGAALVTPGACGSYTTTSRLTPWSSETTAEPESSFGIDQGCHGPLFAPGFAAGTSNNEAGAFSPFSVTFSRSDQDESLAGVTVTTPPGLLGILKGVERCPEPQASQGACGAGSLIGHATVAAGPGPDPVYVQGGQVFLTGPYKGAPFGLSVVVPAVAGPFNLGNVVVRSAISVDPHTARITVSSDPLPSILQGVPLDVRMVNVSIDRPGFIFNPTDCEALSVGGMLTSTQGAQAQVSSHFQAANCAALPFHPSFSVSTQAKTSKKNGASLDVRVGYPSGPQANIHSVAVTLPKQLPSRLTTIQQACPQAVFAANPASCPAGSDIGVATASTPVLAGPVTGPAYLVSHGGAAFPDLVLILQGEGITLDLIGSIDIKHGVTSSTFASVPDAPISSFELSLPEGSHSGLAAVVPAKARGSLCGQSLVMPTTITGQNGAQITQSTKIKVTGCPKKKAGAKKHKKAKK